MDTYTTGEKDVFVEISNPFKVAMGVIIGVILIGQLLVVGSIWWFKANASLRLSQPPLLALFVLAGAFATASSILLLPLNDNFCKWREPLILLFMNGMGNILAGRLWRSSILMSPILSVGRARQTISRTGNTSAAGADTSSVGGGGGGSSSGRRLRNFATIRETLFEEIGGNVRNTVMNSLLILSDLEGFMYMIKCNYCRKGGAKTNNTRRKRNVKSIRQKIALSRMIFLTFVMEVPQFVLQICNICIPSLQSYKIYHPQVSIGGETIYIASCSRDTLAGGGSTTWPTALGIALAALPFVLSICLAYWSAELPRAFNESVCVKASTQLFLLVVITAGPSHALGTTPDAKSFAKIATVIGLVLPFSWCIAVWKLRSMKQIGHTQRDLKVQSKGKRSNNGGGGPTSTSAQAAEAGSNEKAAHLALTIGKLYEDMGLTQNSVKLFDEALQLWCFDPNRGDSLFETESSSHQLEHSFQDNKGSSSGHNKLIGGYTELEINSFTSNDLEFILQLTIAKAKVLASHQSFDLKGQKVAAQAWVDALDIYEHSPESLNIRDKSIIFPIFSGLFVFLKSGVISEDKRSFERDVVEKLLSETRLFGDSVHLCRALAMKAAFLARFTQYEEALELFREMRDLYVAEEHSTALTLAYGSDRCAQAYSQSALWHMALGNEKEALSMCDYVIDRLMPKMEEKDVYNSTMILLPVIRILKYRGKVDKVKQVFEEHIMYPYLEYFNEDKRTIYQSLYKPLSILLDVETSIITSKSNSTENMDESIKNTSTKATYTSQLPRNTLVEYAAWLSEDENGLFTELVEKSCIEMGWDPHTIVCEACLLLGKILKDDGGGNALCRRMVKKGLKLAQITSMKMLDEEGCEAEFPIPFEVHFPIAEELDNLSDMLQKEKGTRRRSTLTKGSSADTLLSSIGDLPFDIINGTNDDEDKISIRSRTAEHLRGSVGRKLSLKLPIKFQRRTSLDSFRLSA